MHEKILAIDEVFGRDGAVEGGELLLIQAHTVALYELTHLTLAGEYLPPLLAEDLNGRLTELVAQHGVVGHVLEYVVEGGLVELFERLAGGFSKEDVACGDGHVERFARVNHHSHLLGEAALQGASARILPVLGDKALDGLPVEVGEDADIPLSLVICHVEPELIEGVWGRAFRVKPYVSALGFAEFLAIRLRNERAGDAEGLHVIAQCAADQLRSRGHIAPLVVAAQLQTHAVGTVEVKEIVALEELIGELGEGKAVARRAVEPLLHALLGHHVVDGDVFSHLADEIKEREVLHPVVVVDHFGLVGCRPFEVEELGYLLLDGLLVVVEGFGIEEIALQTLSRRVTDHARCSPDQQVRFVSAALQVAQHHNATQVPNVERVGGRVGAEVGRHGVFQKVFLGARHDLREHTTPFQLFNKILHRNRMRCFYMKVL